MRESQPKLALLDFQEALAKKLRDAGQESAARLHDTGQVFFPGDPTAKLCQSLIREESDELIYALENEDKAAVLKELCDYLYVGYRVAAIYGLDVARAFIGVHLNNLLKIDTGLVNSAGKLVKPVDHPAVNLEHLV